MMKARIVATSDVIGDQFPLTAAGLAWLRQYFIDTYNDDWATTYQLELVGEVPADVLVWSGYEQAEVAS